CPCALGLASPAVAAAAMSKAFKRGALLKSGSALERLAEIDAVVLDKTGTIEAPEPALKSELSDETLTIACALSQGSRHPFSRTLLAEANSRGLTTIQATDIQEFAGEGLKGQFQGQNIRLGSAAFVGATPGDGMETWLAIEGQTPIRIAFASTPREGAAAMVDGLRKLGIEVSLLSGDRERAVSTCAEALNIDNWIAGATPAEKLHKVQEISASGRKVLMVGDGINDVGAIAAAHVSAAMASGLEAARSNADVVLMKSDLLGVAQLIQTARSARRRILENFWLAGLYNACAIPLAIAGYASPLAAALAMSSSSILVVLNAMRVK
ncbi:MAG: HAD-IC family P-type ATPase, partial [Pikeienuella sp.]